MFSIIYLYIVFVTIDFCYTGFEGTVRLQTLISRNIGFVLIKVDSVLASVYNPRILIHVNVS